MAASTDTAWEFFSNPANLSEITPPEMHFDVKSSLPKSMYPGLLIYYTVTPLWGIPLKWVTEITHVDAPRMFVDNQRFGPYRMWQHRHIFAEISGGVEMQDLVTYVLPFDPFSRPVNGLIVQKKLDLIFDFRHQVIARKFGTLT